MRKLSICVCGNIKRKCIDEDLLERFLADYDSSKSNIIREKYENGVSYEVVNNENEEIISFISEEEATIDKFINIIKFFIYINVMITAK